MNDIYVENGYRDRDHYLACLAEDYGMSEYDVQMIANLYGPNEDFDGLIIALEDFQDYME